MDTKEGMVWRDDERCAVCRSSRNDPCDLTFGGSASTKHVVDVRWAILFVSKAIILESCASV